MICKQCGASNDDSATYCKECGSRLDGKEPCPVCGAFNSEDSKYCSVCGARVDGKIVCPNCGTAYEGNFCPDCGRSVNGVFVKNNAAPSAPVTASVPVPAPSPETAQENKPSDKTKLNKVMDLVSSICVFAAAMLAVIFTFCIGVNIYSDGVWVSNSDVYLLEYLGGVYRNLGEAQFSQVFPLVIGTLIAVATLVLILVFGIITLVKGIKYFTKKQEKGLVKYSFATWAVFITASALLLVLKSANYNIGYVGEVELNSATESGIVLTGLSLAGFIVCRIIANARSFKGKAAILITCFRGGILLLLIIAAACACAPVMNVNDSNAGIVVSYGYGMMFTLNTASADEALVATYYAMCVLGLLCNIAVICLLVKAICNLIRNIANGESFNFLGIILPATILATFSFVFAIFATVIYFGTDNGINLAFDYSGAAYVLTFMATVAEIVGYNIHKKMASCAPAAQPVPAAQPAPDAAAEDSVAAQEIAPADPFEDEPVEEKESAPEENKPEGED